MTEIDGTPAEVEKVKKRVVMTCKRWHVLETMAKAHRWEKMAELGTYKGWTLFHLLKHCPKLHITAVDFYRQPEGWHREVYPDDMEHLYRHVTENLKPYPLRARLMRMETDEAARWIPDLSLDAVFIDADHRKKMVRSDINAWLPKIKMDGWMLGHDWHHTEVKAAVTDIFDDCVILPDNVWAVKC